MWSRGLAPGQAFDASRTEPALVDLLEAKDLKPPLPPATSGASALVPGCGRGYAVVSLARAGYVAEGVEISPTAVKAAREYIASQGVDAQVREADYFRLEPARPYSLVFDSTFLCALPPAMRDQWAQKMATIVSADGELITNIFPNRPAGAPDPADGDVGTGPPYALSPRLVEGLLTAVGFAKISVVPVPPARQARGVEFIGRWRRLKTSG